MSDTGYWCRAAVWTISSFFPTLPNGTLLRTQVHKFERLMHDGESVQLDDAIRRHRGEAEEVTKRFFKLKPADQKALLAFLQSCSA